MVPYTQTMSLWSNIGKALKVVVQIGATAVTDTVAAGKPITLGNIGKSAAGVVAKK